MSTTFKDYYYDRINEIKKRNKSAPMYYWQDIFDEYLDSKLKEKGITLTKEQKDYLKSQYGDKLFNLFDLETWGDQNDLEGLDKALDALAYDESIGYQPDLLTSDQLDAFRQEASQEIDNEVQELQALYDASNNRINSLYDQILARQTDAYQNELNASNDAYNAYANQILANDIQAQNANQGAYRYELDRSQRNAISRGASAAMRLVTNINTNLKLQNQSAQQSLETSNVLAQALLNQRQAAAGLRQSYTSDLNTAAQNKANQMNNYTSQIAGLRNGLTERKFQHGSNIANWKQYLNEVDNDAWNEKVSNKYAGDAALEGIYRSNYGYGRPRRSSGSTI